jgi:transposase-like protein
MGVVAITEEFPTEEACLGLLERIRWPEGVRCINPSFCGSTNISRFTARSSVRKVQRASGDVEEVSVPERFLFECMECGYQFSVTTGTVFHKTHLPLRKWFYAIALTLNAERPLTTRQMKRDLEVSQKTAWLLNRRLGEVLKAD